LNPTGYTENALLLVDQMGQADESAIAGGTPGETLMENAGKAIADAIIDRWQPQPTAILCGPGNNGGDGFVVARLLQEEGWPVRLGLMGNASALKGDAKIHSERWQGPIESLDTALLEDSTLVVDALFGAGLSRPPSGEALTILQAIDDRTCVAVDMPSGVDGNNGEILGFAPLAHLTITFFRKKPGHLLYPGRRNCGELLVADIGIPEIVLEEISPNQAENSPNLWLDKLPPHNPEQHKFSRGYAVICGSAEMPGAAILAAAGARRTGLGMVTMAVPKEGSAVYRLGVPGGVTRTVRDTATFSEVIEDPRVNAVLIGPGHGISVATRERALAALRLEIPTVLDADAITVFGDCKDLLLSTLKGPCILTPHEGEFKSLFDHEGDKLSRARAAAQECDAVILLKGADTVVAAPDGRAVINTNAPPTLATAGAGDVLAGIVTAFLARGMPAFEAAIAGAWLHGEAAARFGAGLIAEDIPEMIPKILKQIEFRQY